MSRNASASQWPRPRIACCRQGPGSPAASARIQPVLRRSCPSSPSRNRPADAATRSCVNNGRIRAFTSRSDAAQSSSVSSIDAPLIHPLPTTREKVRASHPNCNCSAKSKRGIAREDRHFLLQHHFLQQAEAHPRCNILEPPSRGDCLVSGGVLLADRHVTGG